MHGDAKLDGPRPPEPGWLAGEVADARANSVEGMHERIAALETERDGLARNGAFLIARLNEVATALGVPLPLATADAERLGGTIVALKELLEHVRAERDRLAKAPNDCATREGR